MATESPIRMLETGRKWAPLNEATNFTSTEELGSLLKGHRFNGSGRDMVPNRSGSAPPSMEGSFAAIENLIISQHNSNLHTSLAELNTAIENCESEEQLRADPAYLSYYFSNVNLNPRLPPPITSWENRRLVRHIGSFGNNWKTGSSDDGVKGSLHLSRGYLATHKEESEDERSPQRASDDWPDRASEFWSEQDLLAGQHKSLVDLIQEDFPRTPSPIYNLSRSLSHESRDENPEHDADSSSLRDPSVSTENTVTSVLTTDDMALSLNLHPSTTESTPPRRKGYTNSPDTHLLPEKVVATCINNSDVTSIESGIKAFSISSHSNSEIRRDQEEWLSHQYNSLQNQARQQQIQVPGPSTFGGTSQYLQSSSNVFGGYAAAAAASYMSPANPFYSSMQPAGPFSPQYSAGGYALNSPTILPPFMAGYPPHNAIPLGFDSTSGPGPNFSNRTSGFSSGENVAPGFDVHHMNKFYGPLGFAVQTPYVDPLYMQYFQQPFGSTYNVSSQYDPMTPRGGGGVRNLNPTRGGILGSNYLGSPTPSLSNTGLLMQLPSSPLASPGLPRSPISVASIPGERNEPRALPGTGRNAGSYSGWQGQRGVLDNFDDPKTHSFLEELKSGKGRRFELSDIAGHIVEFSADQHGSRFIQQKLENCSVEEKVSVFKEVLPYASKLMTDVFGNYVIQKFFEYGTPGQRKELAHQLAGQILPLSLQMYGCRVIQKALEVIEVDQKIQLVRELEGHVMRCVRDQNGNHVIQKCIESVPSDKIGFIISAFRGQVATLSTHPYGCRVIQRVLEHCTDEVQCQFIVDEILESVCPLAQDQYGNYVTQHVLERGKPHERSQIISKFEGLVVQMSQHKFASNVVEKCLEYGDAAERELLIKEIVGRNDGNDNLLIMMKDQFANYVVQKIIETCTDSQREILLARIKIHLNALKKYTYGKHIVARFEQLYGEEFDATES